MIYSACAGVRSACEHQAWTFEDYSLTVKLADKIVSEAAVAGTRAAPSQSAENDKHIGVRLDYGETFNRGGKKVRHVKVQPNKGENNPSLKDLAAKKSHQVVAEAFIPIDSAYPKGAVRGMFKNLRGEAAAKDTEKEVKKNPRKVGKK
ncbi:hypothetical protein MBLNU13_g07729t2 [Cladosporium sp. NU13]